MKTSESMTKKMEIAISQAEADIVAGRVSRSFSTVEELFEYLDSL